MPMENFFRIRAEKQSHIVNAAFMIFGRQGYRKASLSDIAQEAGITKGMITYYFGSKKTLYMYLVDVSQTMLAQATSEQMSNRNIDFFERLRLVTEVNMSAMKEHPALISFTNSLYSESDPEVSEDIAERVASLDYPQSDFFMEGAGASGFKSEYDPDIMCRFMVWAVDGFMMELYEKEDTETNADILANKFYRCLDVMQTVFTNLKSERNV